MAPAAVLTHVEDPYASHWSCRARAPCAEETFDDHWTCRERPPPVSTPRKTFLARRAAASTPDVGQPMRHPGVLALPQDKTLVNLEGNIGAGKTTLLRVIAGLEPDFSGQVEFCGEIWHDGDHPDQVPTHQRGLGVVFHDGRLLPGRTVERNLAFAQQRARNADAAVSYEALMEALDLNHLLSEPAEVLSGGERQRVALARALLV